jgi:hypothetical protein
MRGHLLLLLMVLLLMVTTWRSCGLLEMECFRL